VAVTPLTDSVERFADLTKVFLEGETAVETVVESVRNHKNHILMRFEGVETRTAAEGLVGKFVSVSEADLIDLPEQTYFQFDIIGMQVVNEDDHALGTISEIIRMPAHDLWRVEGEKEFLLPAVANFVLKVSKTERKVIVRLPDGLLDQ
jgi:16S rRNA processing protein RimM